MAESEFKVNVLKNYTIPEFKGKTEEEYQRFDYLVIETGYTSRLVKKLAELNEALKEAYLDCKPVIISDHLWGMGMYSIGEIKKEKIDKIMKYASYDGIIAFTSTSKQKLGLNDCINIGDVLRSKVTYCSNWGISNINFYKDKDYSVCVLRYDCESG